MRCGKIKGNSFIFSHLGLCHNNNNNNKKEAKVNIATVNMKLGLYEVAAAGPVFWQQLQKHRREMEG